MIRVMVCDTCHGYVSLFEAMRKDERVGTEGDHEVYAPLVFCSNDCSRKYEHTVS